MIDTRARAVNQVSGQDETLSDFNESRVNRGIDTIGQDKYADDAPLALARVSINMQCNQARIGHVIYKSLKQQRIFILFVSPLFISFDVIR